MGTRSKFVFIIAGLVSSAITLAVLQQAEAAHHFDESTVVHIKLVTILVEYLLS